ncbi:MAG: acyl-CoA synthetase [Gemmatimonadota bacterium]|nr:acyl-CoA synthetase [Gemmatimonadota bacterium]MEC9317926.1 acyl-CoA synthetase [Gemmatimonadota bacterium]
MSKYDQDMEPRGANHVALTPLSFLQRTASVYPDRIAIRYVGTEQSWSETFRRCCRLADALRQRGVGRNDTVAVLCPNTPAAVELSFAVPMAGAVLNMINTRLDAEMVGFILDHGEASVFMVDQDLADVGEGALRFATVDPLVIDIEDSTQAQGSSIGEVTYEALIEEGSIDAGWSFPPDEWDAIALNYTSGTTGNPKGVVYHHRGAYLNALGNALEWSLPQNPTYLWTLPLFHCNGWCFPWTVAAVAGTNVCTRGVDPAEIIDLIVTEDITHMCGAPIVVNMVTTEAERRGERLPHLVRMMTAGAAPPAAVLDRAGRVGLEITHVYGLTECYGPNTVCAWHPEWDELPAEDQAILKARQGVPYVVQEELAVLDPETMEPVPADGETIGEIMMRGNVLMKGYLKNPTATSEAFAEGYFHTGDLAVLHPDGYAEIRDRSKDIIISGGENISSIEVEGVLYRHPAISAAAVVSRPDDHWGETPCAFVELREGSDTTELEIIDFCRDHMAHFKAPKTVVFGELPKTSTGKIQKFVLRERARDLSD